MAGHDDNSFGPQYGHQFDFTLRFEHLIFTILPASLLIAAIPVLIYHYTRKPAVISRGWLLYAKLVSLSARPCHLCLQPGLIAQCIIQPNIQFLIAWHRMFVWTRDR